VKQLREIVTSQNRGIIKISDEKALANQHMTGDYIEF